MPKHELKENDPSKNPGEGSSDKKTSESDKNIEKTKKDSKRLPTKI